MRNSLFLRCECYQSIYILGYLVGTTSPAVLCRPLWNLIGVSVVVWRYVCGLDTVLPLIFVTFFRILNLVVFHIWILLKCIDSGYLVCATPPTVLYQSFWNFTGVFFMVWRYACGLDIILRSIFFFIDSSYSKKKKLKGGGHKFTEFACLTIIWFGFHWRKTWTALSLYWQEFVVIQSSPRKPKVLTEHQKEVMKERK